jgi:hypothetical protein
MAARVSLQGMMIADALAIVERRLDPDFATELAQLERALVRDGVNRDSIDAMLEHENAERGQTLIISRALTRLPWWRAKLERGSNPIPRTRRRARWP